MTMKRIFTLTLLILFSYFTQAQEFDVVAENDRISANISAAGWIAANENGSHFYIKGHENVPLMYGAGLWLTTEVTGRLTHCVVHSSEFPPQYQRFTTGVLDRSFSENLLLNIFQKVFPITRDEIDAHISDWEDNGIIDETPSENLLGWPVASNADFSSIHSSSFPDNYNGPLAPFFDRNNDGIYNVYEGDYPLVNGDKAWWCAYSDEYGSSYGYKSEIGAEVHQLAYLYETGNSVVDQSIFFDYQVTNKSEQDWDTMFWGAYSDPDIGACAEFTYVGSIPETGVAYSYANGVTSCKSNGGVTADVPILSTISMDEFSLINYFSAEFVPGMPFEQSFPEAYTDLLNGRFLSLGGNGYENGTPHSFIFDGTEIDGVPWTECTNESETFDRRMISRFSKSKVLQGETLKEKIALNVKYEIPHPCPNRNLIQNNAEVVKHFESSYTDYIQNNVNRPIALFDFNNTDEFTVEFEDNSLFNVDNWFWEFADLGTSNEQHPSFGFPGAGTYEVCLTTTNQEGDSKLCRLVHLNYGLRPVADFNYTLISDNIVRFEDISTNDPHTLVWELGDDRTNQQNEFIHQFPPIHSEIEVCLNAINDHGVDKICKLINLVTSNEELVEETMFSLFPNPTTNNAPLIISYTGPISNDMSIEITDLLGGTVYKRTQFEKILDISNLNSGMYIVHLKKDKTIIQSQNLVVF